MRGKNTLTGTKVGTCQSDAFCFREEPEFLILSVQMDSNGYSVGLHILATRCNAYRNVMLPAALWSSMRWAMSSANLSALVAESTSMRFFRIRIPFLACFMKAMLFALTFNSLRLRGAGQAEICHYLVWMQIEDPEKDCFDVMLGSDLDYLYKHSWEVFQTVLLRDHNRYTHISYIDRYTVERQMDGSMNQWINEQANK